MILFDGGREILASLPPEGRELYGERIEKIIGATEKFTRRATPPDRVAEVVERALTASRPRTRYLVGSDAKAMARLGRLLPDRMMDALQARFLGI